MTPPTATPPVQLRDPAWRARMTMLLLGLLVLWPMLVASEFRPWLLFERASVRAAGDFLASFFPPALERDFLLIVLEATWQTVAIATAGLALAWIVAVPLTLLATTRLSQSAIGRPMGVGPAVIRQAVRWLLVVLRSVPELVWALLFVRVVGLGPTAGVLAIALTYSGMLGKVYGEILESTDRAPTDALLRNGSSRIGVLLYGSLPQSAPELVSYTVFRWECAVRASVIMGFVGAGGLGQQMEMSMKMLAGGEVATMLAVFMLLVAIADRASRFLRDTLDPVIDRGINRARGVAATGAALALIAAGFAALDLQWRSFLQPDAVARMAEFLAGFVPPDLSPAFVAKVAFGALETVSMSAIGTLLAAVAGVLLAIPAALPRDTLASSALRNATRGLLNGLRSIPELVWAALWVIAAGLGPLPGTLALAAHTTGVIGRLFAESLENLPAAPARALRDNGVGPAGVFLYATLPQALPQLMSYTLYRWENNIRAAAVLGVVGAGGLGQLLHYHLSLFQMPQAATVILAMLLIVAAVDAVSHVARRRLTA